MITFEVAVERLLDHEGGYIFHPADPGGETKFGISKRSYPDIDIKNLTRDQAIAIYRRDYWNPVGSRLHPAVSFQVFDAAVNHGMGNAVRILQRAVGVADDGHWGRISQAAYDVMGLSDVLMRFLAYRLHFMRKLTRFNVFGAGWSGRIADNLLYAAQDN